MSFGAALRLLEVELGRAFPAAALAYGEGGVERLRAAVGAASLDTWFDLASLTKALCTSLLCLRQCAAGGLSLEEQVLPGVTVAQLLGHCGGLPAWLPLYEAAVGREPAEARAAVVAAAARAPRQAAGTRTVYSDLGFILLGDLLERRGGARLDHLFAPLQAAAGGEIGFRPLGEPAAVPETACAPTRRESPARELLQGVVHDDNARAMGGVAGHAGLFGTVGGVSRLRAALLAAAHGADPGLGLEERLLRRLWGPGPLPGSTWGLGWDHPDPRPGHSSAGDLWPRDGVGHLGFTGCSLWLDVAGRRWAVLLSNRVAAETAEAAEQAQERLRLLRPRLHDALLRMPRFPVRSGEKSTTVPR